MKRIIGYLKNYRLEAILGPLFKLAEAILELLVPLVVANIVNEGINGKLGTNFILKKMLLMILLGFLGLLFSLTAQYFSAKAATGLAKEIREALFSKMQSLSYTEIDNLGTARMITQITSDVNQLQNGVNLFLRLFLRSPFIVGGALIMAFIVNRSAGLVFLVMIPLLFLVVALIMRLTRKKYQKIQNNLDDVVKIARENLQGVRVIRAFGREKNEELSFSESLNHYRERQKEVSVIAGLLNPLTYVIVNIAIILVIYASARAVENHQLLQGGVLALYNYLTQILVELIKFANLIVTISKALASMNRINETLDLESTLQFSPKTVGNDQYLAFEKVSFKYKQASDYTLKDISFTVNKGETIGIIGGTGSGKSTLVNLIPHFYDATIGRVIYKGQNVNSYNLEELRNEMGIVPQKAVLFKGTIRSNLLWHKIDATDEELYQALDTAQALEIVNKLDDKLDSVVEQKGQNFSGGQRQRLSIARALVGNPDVLILDDSASALDYLTDSMLRKALKNLKYQPTIFIVSQRTSSIMHADKIIVLDNGELVGIGKHHELLEQCTVYREIYQSQFKKVGDDNE